MPEVIGLDHVYLTVSDLAVAEQFYDRLLVEVLEFRKNRFAIGTEPHAQYYNRLFGIVLRPAREPGIHRPYAPGLHHLCLRVESAHDVHAAAAALLAAGIAASAPVVLPEYAPDYVATYLRDPDGIRLEITNFREERRRRFEAWESLPG